MRHVALILTTCAAPAFAECPPNPEIATALDELVETARQAENDMAGRDVSAQMWDLWLRAPDRVAQDLLDAGMRARTIGDYATAVDAYGQLVDYCPAYAEGYNQRAFINFLRQDYAAALVDLDAALVLAPRHVGAQSGRALTLMHLGRIAEARIQLLAALENNPWLSERFLLGEGGPLAVHGKDI